MDYKGFSREDAWLSGGGYVAFAVVWDTLSIHSETTRHGRRARANQGIEFAWGA